MRNVVLNIALSFLAVTTMAAPFAKSCPQRGKVSLDVDGTPIRIVLKDIAHQGGVNIAIDPHVKGHVKARFECLDVRETLGLVLPQVHAEFCETTEIIRVSREGTHACRHPEPLVNHVGSSGR